MGSNEPLTPPPLSSSSSSKSAENDYLESKPESCKNQVFPPEMGDYEVPTAPPTPTMAPRVPHYPPPPVPVEKLVPKSQASKKNVKCGLVRAHESKCAICFKWFYGVAAQARVDHVNECWDILKKAAQETKRQNVRKHQDLERSEKSKEVDDQSNSALTSETDRTIITPSPYPDGQHPPNSVCPLCHTTLATHDSVSRFAHHLRCLEHHTPLYCTSCSQNFLYPQRWADLDILWHFQICQHGSALSRAEFDAIGSALTGRQEVLCRALLGRENTSAGEQVRGYKAKKNMGLVIGHEVYATDVSELRWSCTHKGDGVEIVGVEETWVRNFPDLREFRRSRFEVLGLTERVEFPDDFEAETVFVETEASEVASKEWTPPKVPPKPALLKSPSISEEKAAGDMARGNSSSINRPSEPEVSQQDAVLKTSNTRPIAHDNEAYTITDLVKTLFYANNDAVKEQVKAPQACRASTSPTPSNGEQETAHHDDINNLSVTSSSSSPAPYHNPEDSPTHLPIRDWKILKTTSFTLTSSSSSSTATTPFSPTPTLPHKVKHFPDLRLTCPEEPNDADVGQQTPNHTELKNGSPRHNSSFINNPPIQSPSLVSDLGAPKDMSLTHLPVAHTIYFPDGRFVVFGGGVVLPAPPQNIQISPYIAERSVEAATHAPGPVVTPQDLSPPADDPISAGRVRPKFLCAAELDAQVVIETFHDPMRGALPESLRSNLRMDRTGMGSVEEYERRAREACRFGGEDELHES